jgi:alkylation response protein AidB-like acyl-CoA dehydrogenase
MDLELPPEGDVRREWVRSWLRAHPAPSDRDLAEAGLVAPHWPAPWGRGADAVEQLVIDDELHRAGVRRPRNLIGIGWAGPTILLAGTPEQQARYLPPLLAGEEIWCQLFSEPDAGSDLAALTTRAERDGDTWVVSGRKIWTSMAERAAFGILLARTGRGDRPQDGITYFVCPMETPGITVRPIVEMTGSALFNEVVLDDVRIPAANVVGQPGDGWRLAKLTLANERVSLSGEGALWGMGPDARALISRVRAAGGEDDPVLRQRLAAVHAEGEVLRWLRLRMVSAAVRGRPPGPESSVRKALADAHGQRVMGLVKDLAGASGMLAGSTEWDYGFLFAPALTIGGGTAEVQRNVIGERVLGLPAEPPPTPRS